MPAGGTPLGDAGYFELGPTRRRIIDLLADGHARSPRQLANELSDLSYENAKKTAKRMADDGQLLVTNGNLLVSS